MGDSASISGNTASSHVSYYASIYASRSHGGGVSVTGGSFAMGGSVSISGNKVAATSDSTDSSLMQEGGGIFIEASSGGGTLTKTGGVIYGSNETGTGADGNPLKNTAPTGSGAAVYRSASKYRNTTVGPGQNLSTGSNDNWSD